MSLSDETRNRLVGLLVVATVLLLSRVAAAELGASAAVQRGLYALALLCLVGCVLVVLQERF